MITRSEDIKTEVRVGMRGGTGSAKITLLKEHLPSNLRLFGVITLNKGDEIGEHNHVGETEVYYIIAGEAMADDNGQSVVLKKGDSMFTGGGATHSIRNEKEEPMTFIAAIVLD